MFRSVVSRGLTGLLLVTIAPQALAQEPLPRSTARAGAIVSAKGGEELQLPREALWHPAVVRQDVIGGDTLRTGEIGTLGITFQDQTTIRVGRQSTLVVNQIATATGNTELTLPTGNVWARASRGGTGVTVKTPAASAAIRGTDWSLSVQGDRTSLVVLEGVVEFSNPQGSVTVYQGEGASARIGERPTKTILVRPDDREQMLFYMELRGLFRGLPATRLDGAARRNERARLAAIPVSARTTEDWVAIAENGFGQDPRDVVLQAVAEARRRLGQRPAFEPGPDDDWTAGGTGARRPAGNRASLSARLDLVEAMLAGSAKRYKEAAALFARAEKGTSGRQRLTAQCGYYAAATMANPKHVLPMPRVGGADQNVCAAYVIGFGKGLDDAEKVLRQTEKSAPRHLLSSMLSAQVSLLLNRRDEMRSTVERMRATDPDAPETLLASGYLKSAIDSDVDGAVADFTRGVAVAPGDSELWNGLGLAESARDAALEAERAFRQAIAVDPQNPVPYANLAILLLDQSRVDEAGKLIDKALALDPSLDAAYTAKGRYYLQKGDMAKAMEFVLAGSAANPASAQGLLAVAITQYQSGDLELAGQALDNADRLDKSDPVTSIVRTAIAVDQLEADAAIINAREAVRRYRNRGGFFAGIATTKTGGSYLGQAYRLLNLEEWGRFYTDRVADPFSATSYFDQSLARQGRPFFTRPTLEQIQGSAADGAGNLVLQGLFFDPLAVAGRLGRIDLLRRPFIDAEIGGSLIRRNGRNGWQSDATVSAFSNEPVPTSVSLSYNRIDSSNRRGRAGGEDAQTAAAFVGIAPSAADRFLLWGTASSAKPDIIAPAITLFDADSKSVKAYQAGAGWSHTFGYRNVLTGAVVASRADQSERRFAIDGGFTNTVVPLFYLLDGRQRRDAKVDALTAALGHTYGFGDFTLRSGLEGSSGRIRNFSRASLTGTIPDTGYSESDETFDGTRSSFRAGRAYTNLQWQPSDRFQVEGGIQVLGLDLSTSASKTYVDPRIGVAVSPVDGQWLRAAWRRDTEAFSGFTLSPITTVGLIPNALPVQLGGSKETMALRWDAEWTKHIFTAVEYQSQRAGNLRLDFSDTLEGIDLRKARIDYLTATANIWLTHGIGVFGTVGMADSSTLDGSGAKVDVPFVPRRFARAGVTFVHPSRITFSVIENYIGERYDGVSGLKLDPFWTTDLTASYETPDRRFLFGLSLLNVFDKRYEQVAATATSEAIPGASRTIAGSIKVRF
ncbi:FecR domain-containing protein [Bosea sp. BK604]|uniref:FecR domain-containing protein n=1 Tax=Bosea sp. BK604 TaxID=2512180 RepID=UPI001052A5DD|nr:FecR domain-containing protein [Bosea sp. BK604]TCR65383.1 FecR family protein [Bosea sp. BK604]